MLSLTGCVSTILAHKVVAPPNKSGIKPLFSDLGILEHAPEAFAETWIVPIRQPRADIAVASIEPGDYAFEYDLQARLRGRQGAHHQPLQRLLARSRQRWRAIRLRKAP